MYYTTPLLDMLNQGIQYNNNLEQRSNSAQLLRECIPYNIVLAAAHKDSVFVILHHEYIPTYIY